jgi:peroxiredoxin
MKKTLFYSALALLTLSVAAFTFSVTGYEPGAVASDFKLKNVDGKMVSLADYKSAKGFIVTFTCNHCPYAKSYEKRLIAIDTKYKALGYPVIAIMPNDTIVCPDDSPTEMVKYAKEKGFTFPYLFDATQETAKAYGALKTPHVYVLHKEKDKLMVKYVGAIDDNYEDASQVTKKYLENAMDELIAGKEISVKTSKAIGCSIKWTSKP